MLDVQLADVSIDALVILGNRGVTTMAIYICKHSYCMQFSVEVEALMWLAPVQLELTKNLHCFYTATATENDVTSKQRSIWQSPKTALCCPNSDTLGNAPIT